MLQPLLNPCSVEWYGSIIFFIPMPVFFAS
jgi:hypothetical protein